VRQKSVGGREFKDEYLQQYIHHGENSKAKVEYKLHRGASYSYVAEEPFPSTNFAS
jgi:hypothetical protein